MASRQGLKDSQIGLDGAKEGLAGGPWDTLKSLKGGLRTLEGPQRGPKNALEGVKGLIIKFHKMS